MKPPLISYPLLAASLFIVTAAAGLYADDVQPRPSNTADQPDARVLKFISYNVQFLPGWASIKNERKDPEYRARTLGKVLTDFDVVGLNEVFHKAHRKILLDRMKETWGQQYNAVIIPKPPSRMFNGGLAIVSHLPFLETHSMVYTHWSKPGDYGLRADGFAAKGALHARILHDRSAGKDDYFDVFITHLEARDDDVRVYQFTEFSDFVWMHASGDHPVVLMGDFNTDGKPSARNNRNSRYNLLLPVLRRARPALLDLWPTLSPAASGCTTEQESTERGKRIDYIFLANPPYAPRSLKALAIRVNGFLDPHVVALSDHSAVEGDFVWQVRN